MSGITSQSTSNWTKYFRQMVTQMIVDSPEVIIGGPGKIVQIDESKFGKTKLSANGQGRRVEGSWVFGGVEKTNQGEPNGIFAVVVENCSAATLLPLIKRCVSQNKNWCTLTHTLTFFVLLRFIWPGIVLSFRTVGGLILVSKLCPAVTTNTRPLTTLKNS